MITNIKKANITTGVSGRVTKLVVIKGDGTQVDYPGARNLIVDSGLDMLAAPTTPVTVSGYCRVGTGTAAPVSTQTDLISRHGSVSGVGTNAVQSNSGGAPWWHEYERTYEFAAGTVDGAALTEVGFFRDSTTGDMWSRLLIKDGGGNPTSITLLPDEVLRISYAIRVNVPTGDTTGSFDIDEGAGPVAYSYTLRPSNAGSNAAWGPGTGLTSFSHAHLSYETNVLGSETSNPSGPSDLFPGATISTYVSGSFENHLNLNMGTSDSNFTTGIGSLAFRNASDQFPWQVSFSPKIPKDNTKTLALNNFFKVTWARV